ncbi:MAG: hypothetical protein E7538_01785 [Ruminococcaceae bacterium]|nr:hypothetical protein [Oscillospiraceae bacterium]
MKKLFSLLLCVVVLITCCVCQSGAVDEKVFIPDTLNYSLTEPVYSQGEGRATGLILAYGMLLSVSGNTLRLQAETNCLASVVKCGFKDFTLQRKKLTSTVWSNYYEYGDIFFDTFAANVNTTLNVSSGYQYRISCKHYAKKSLLVTQNISNTSNVVIV